MKQHLSALGMSIFLAFVALVGGAAVDVCFDPDTQPSKLPVSEASSPSKR
jgi:hypothetical protein